MFETVTFKHCCVKLNVLYMYISSLDSTCFLCIWLQATRLCGQHCSTIHLMFVDVCDAPHNLMQQVKRKEEREKKAGRPDKKGNKQTAERAESTIMKSINQQLNNPPTPSRQDSAALTAQRSTAGTICGENDNYFSSTP